MKRLILYIVAFLFLLSISCFYIVKYKSNTIEDYRKWEIQCINEYYESQEYYILVDTTMYKMFVFKNDELIKEYKVSTGTYNTPSPIGTWRIISKADWGEGFGGTWMGLNVPWGKYGIHGTLSPNSIGWNSSKGCVRMFNKDAKELASFIKHGTKVEIYSGPFGAFGSSFRTLLPGDRGADVMEVQRLLKKMGYYYGNPDGVFGPNTETAVLKFQKEHKLKQDKKVGANMYKLLGIEPFE